MPLLFACNKVRFSRIKALNVKEKQYKELYHQHITVLRYIVVRYFLHFEMNINFLNAECKPLTFFSILFYQTKTNEQAKQKCC